MLCVCAVFLLLLLLLLRRARFCALRVQEQLLVSSAAYALRQRKAGVVELTHKVPQVALCMIAMHLWNECNVAAKYT